MTAEKFNRRTMLRAAGAALALPSMASALPRAAWAASEAAKPPVRMGIFSVTGGTVLESWKNPQAGPLDKLPSILRPLEFCKDDLLVIHGLCQGGRVENANGHEYCSDLHLTASELARREKGKIFNSISVDQAAAQVTAQDTLLPSLELGQTLNMYSFAAGGVPVPSEANPRLVFNRMFRGRQPVVPNWSRRAAGAYQPSADRHVDSSDQSVLDLVLAQAAGLKKKLGTIDRAKMDQYLDSVRSVEQRIAFLEARLEQEAADSRSPGPSQVHLPSGLPDEGVPHWKITQPIDSDPEKHGEYIALLGELMVLAFQTDTTRVVTLAAGSDEALFPGVVTVGYERHCHTLEHQGNADRPENADPIAREACRQIHQWYTQAFGRMLRQMKDIDEGGSSLLDNSMILYTSYMADGGHGRDNYPVLLAGKAGGTIKPGRQIEFADRAPVANLYVEMLNRMGAKVDRFGESQTSPHAGKLGGRLPGLV